MGEIYLRCLLNVVEPDPPHLVRVAVVLVAHHTAHTPQSPRKWCSAVVQCLH